MRSTGQALVVMTFEPDQWKRELCVEEVRRRERHEPVGFSLVYAEEFVESNGILLKV